MKTGGEGGYEGGRLTSREDVKVRQVTAEVGGALIDEQWRRATERKLERSKTK